MNTQIGDRAVVLGASMAGLLAARVLTDAYGQVTVIDRDELSETPTHRRGVPHGRHIHALAARGQQVLEELFPGLTAELIADGAPAGDMLTDARFYLSGHRLRQTLDAATPQIPRTGAIQRLEGDRWMLTLAGILGDHPPTDPDGFLDFARSLRFPDIYKAVRDGEPLDDPVGFRFPASVRHRYERQDRFPAGFLAVGDAVCSFNPIYGQGMSVAALEALTLRSHLERGIEPQPRRWFRDVARVVDVPWDMSAGGDLAFRGVPGHRTLKIRLLGGYLSRLHAGAADDAHLATAFIRVAGLVAPPQSLLSPGIALRVLRGGHARRLHRITHVPRPRMGVPPDAARAVGPLALRAGRSTATWRPTRAPMPTRERR